MLGIWKNFDELEESLSLAELEQLLNTKAEHEHREKKFFAALKGIDIDEGKQQTDIFSNLKEELRNKSNSGVMQGFGYSHEGE